MTSPNFLGNLLSWHWPSFKWMGWYFIRAIHSFNEGELTEVVQGLFLIFFDNNEGKSKLWSLIFQNIIKIIKYQIITDSSVPINVPAPLRYQYLKICVQKWSTFEKCNELPSNTFYLDLVLRVTSHVRTLNLDYVSPLY